MFKYGWKPQRPDFRDLKFRELEKLQKDLPALVDLREHCPSVYDQGGLGSCTANAIAFLCEFDQIKEKKKEFVPSRLFIYYNERELEHSTDYDSGAALRDGIKSLNLWGFAPEPLWPYDISKFKDQPPISVYRKAAKHKVVRDYGVVDHSLNEMKAVIASGFPIVIGFVVYASFESREVMKTGIVPMPKPDEGYVGGHAVAIVGYDDAKQWWITRNSWGEHWGDKGYFYMPYEYFTDPHLSMDLWAVRFVR